MTKSVQIETFYWKGQLRYRCPLNWESGARCEFDTHDLVEMKKHIGTGHTRSAGLKTEIYPKDSSEKDFTTTHDPEFENVKFMDDKL